MCKASVQIVEQEFFAKRYRLADYVVLAQTISLPLESWLGLGDSDYVKTYGYPAVIMDAVIKQVSDRIREENQQRREQENKFKLESMNIGSNLDFGRSNESMSRTFHH